MLTLLPASHCTPARPARQPRRQPTRRPGDTGDEASADAGGKLFEFHSQFWLNLHHFLYAQARGERADERERVVLKLAAGNADLGALPPEQRRGWAEAVAYYEREVAARDLIFDDAAVMMKTKLAALDQASTTQNAGLEPGLSAVLEGAAPGYRALWWPAHDAANRRWIDAMSPVLRAKGGAIAGGVASAFRTRWPAAPLRVDVSPCTNWAGAYTTSNPAHVMISSVADGCQGTLGLEILFHESLHTLDDAIEAAREGAGRAAGKEIPYHLTHAIIFYTAAAMTRRAFPGHTPYFEVKGLSGRGPLARYFPIVRRHWQPYLDGTATFDEAFARIVAEV